MYPYAPNHNRKYFHPNHIDKFLKKILKEAGVPDIHFHDLRHSAATILLYLDVNVKVVQELLWHSDISVTLRVYGHLLPSMQQTVVETWDDVFGGYDKDSNDSSALK